jgi:hypothetical protein
MQNLAMDFFLRQQVSLALRDEADDRWTLKAGFLSQ